MEGKKYKIVFQPDCAKYGWHAEGNGTSFDLCTATKGDLPVIAIDSHDQPSEAANALRASCRRIHEIDCETPRGIAVQANSHARSKLKWYFL
jgi:hypothetical protein